MESGFLCALQVGSALNEIMYSGALAVCGVAGGLLLCVEWQVGSYCVWSGI